VAQTTNAAGRERLLKREHEPLIEPSPTGDAIAPSATAHAESYAAAQPAPASPPGATQPHRGRLFRKYLLLILSLVTAALLAASGIGLYFSYQEHRSALASLQNEKAVAAASRIEQYMRQVSQQVVFASLPQLDAADLEARRLEFLKLLRQAPEVTDIVQLDEAGREQIAVSRLGMDLVASRRDRSDEAAFREARRGQAWFGPVYFRKETEPYLTIAARAGGERGPVTIAEVNLKFIWDVVSRIQVGTRGKAYVVDAGGFLVADPDIGLVLRKTNLAQLEHVQAAPTIRALPDPAMASRDAAGTRVLVSAATIDPPGWHVFVEQPVAEVYAKLDASIARTALLLLGGLAASALAALALARGMVRPIRLLDEGARRIGEGQLEQQIVVRTGDEIEGLADQFNRMSAQLRESYAGLERKVEQRTAELSESLQYQTAISQVLRVISESPTDVQPVFEAIVDSAVRLLDSPMAAVFRYDGRLVHRIATRNWPDEALRRVPQSAPPNPGLINGRAILQRQALSVEDTLSDSDYDHSIARAGQWRRMLAVPMLKDAEAVGVLVVAWPDPGQTPRRQLELLQTFADQAVIAIENVRLINETKEALEQQTATAEILRVISASITDVQPVFEAIVASCRRLFGGRAVALTLPRGPMLETLAFASDGTAQWGDGFLKPWPLDRDSAAGACILDASTIVVADTVEGAQRFRRMHELASALGYRSGLFVPLLRDGKAIGCIAILRPQAGAFSAKEVALAQTFADQAVIAIENVRLFNETNVALERQTAIAEVLRVISGSPTDVQPVLDTVAERARLLCRADGGRIWLASGGELRAMTDYGARYAEGRGETLPISRGSIGGRAFVERRCVHVDDVVALSDSEYPDVRALQARYGFRTVLAVPLLREDEAIGVIALLRSEVRPFAADEIALVQTFADQAVIAIENVRLFNETKEALEQQTATSEVLQVISSSPTDVQPVFDTIAERARTLCAATMGAVTRFDGDLIHLQAFHGTSTEGTEAMLGAYPLKAGSGHANGRAIRDRAPAQIADVLADPEYLLKEASGKAGYRSALAVPMLREGQVVGSIAVTRAEPGAFPDKLVKLLQTFADQAVIAIENVRLFNETKEALERQKASADVLGVISSSIADARPVFDRILTSCERLFAGHLVGINVVGDDGLIRIGAYHGPGREDFESVFPLALEHSSGSGLAILERRVLHYPDVANSPDVPEGARRGCLKTGTRACVFAPLLWEGRGLGAIFVGRNRVGEFADKDIALLKTFADQAAIAMQNARLFNETREALQRQTAIAEVLRVIAASPTDLQPVLDAIADHAARLADAAAAAIYLIEGDALRRVSAQGELSDPQSSPLLLPITPESTSGRAVLERATIHVDDMLAEAERYPLGHELARRYGHRTIVVAPLLREGRAFGTILLRRQEVRPFSEREIALLRTFGDQAVIALENARLFHEIQEKSQQLEIADRHKSEFLANMSHELRTPLNAVIGFSEVLLERMFGELNAKQAEYLDDIHSSGHHLLSLINDILDLSKIEAGRMELDLSSFDLGALLGNCMTLVKERASRHGLALTLDAQDVGEWTADARKVKQIVINLLSNAVKFTPSGGSVTLRVRGGDAAVEIAVIDTGVGIAPADQAVVFEEFRQASGEYLRKAEGTGLGLALARRFVELHGGTIRLDSEVGRGSTFTFTLPQRVAA
jgi:GAF domain-containing protein/HAMP domain-containing protein